MVEIHHPDFELISLEETETEIDIEATVGKPKECEISEEKLHDIKSGTISRVNRNSTGDTLQPIPNIDINFDDEVESFEIDLEDLWRMIYEHRRYATAKGFSDSELQVLKAIENRGGERVTTNMITNSKLVEDYSDGTIHRSLNNLQDKDLIRKHEHGLYSINEISEF